MVSRFLNQDFGFFEVGAGCTVVARRESIACGDEVIVGEVKAHAGAGGDAKGFVEIVGSAAGEEGERELLEVSAPAEVLDGLVEVVNGLPRVNGVGAAEREVVEADGAKPEVSFSNGQGL